MDEEEGPGGWSAAVTAGMQPGHRAFIACLPTVLIIGGEHPDEGGFCWCQPKGVPHMDHTDWLHRRTMD